LPQEATVKQEAAENQEAEETKYWFSSLAPQTSLERLVTLAHARWIIEQFYEDAKQECGLDDFQGRRWDGLHRHLALVMLAYSFLALQRLQLPLPIGEAFPPSVTRSSLPHAHRQVLFWLFQDLVLWLVQSDQIKTFRLRRN
jgi:Transposase DDE domain